MQSISTVNTLALLITPVCLCLLYYTISDFIYLLIQQHFSPLRALRGPPSPSFFTGNLNDMHDQENNNLVEKWEAQYGPTFVYKGFIGGCRLMTTDLGAVAHIFGHAYDYPKPDFIRDSLAQMAAGHGGLLTVEGDTHKRQRRILTPAFASSHVKSLTPIFWEKATQLRDIWLKEAEETPHPRIDALAWLSRATLDVIGLAGFGYTFNSLVDNNNELANAFSVVFSTARQFRVMTILQVWFPCLRRFRRNNAAMTHAKATMRRIGLGLIEEKKEEVANDLATAASMSDSDSEKTPLTPTTPSLEADKSLFGRDVLSVLIRSNISTNPTQRMSIPEILSQINTVIAAGHETTAAALTWTLYALSRSPESQHRLRQSFHTLPPSTTRPSDHDIFRLPYLDWVVREALRLHAPVASTMRVATRDDEIPVRKPYEDRDGKMRDVIRVTKGDMINIPIQAINKSKELWGEDAYEFRPERWECPPEETKSIPGLYSNLLTFLNGNPLNGNRACIGIKFALAEIKILLYVLVRDIEFSMDPSMVIEKKINVVTRPFVKSEPSLGNQMPLYIRPVSSCSDTPQPSTTSFSPPSAPLTPTSPSLRLIVVH